jgi:hypothetical protein
MSDNTRNIVDYAINDQGKELRDALYAEIHDRVTAQFESSKIALAKNLFATEETITEDVGEEEDAGVEGDEDEESECSSKKKKMKKESYDEEDEEYDDEYDEDDE